MNSLPNTVTLQRRDCDLNPGPSAPESSTLTTRLPSHPMLSVGLSIYFNTVRKGACLRGRSVQVENRPERWRQRPARVQRRAATGWNVDNLASSRHGATRRLGAGWHAVASPPQPSPPRGIRFRRRDGHKSPPPSPPVVAAAAAAAAECGTFRTLPFPPRGKSPSPTSAPRTRPHLQPNSKR